MSGIFFSFVSLFLKKKEHFVVNSLFHSDYTDNGRSIFEALYNASAYQGNVYFVLNNAAERNRLNKQYPGCFISNKSYRGIKLILTARYWVVSSLTLPLPGYFNKMTRTVYLCGHGLPLKKAGLAGNAVSWYKTAYYKLMATNISYAFASSSFFTEKLCMVYGLDESQITLMPSAKQAQIKNRSQPSNRDTVLANGNNTQILYAPTWRPYGNVNIFPFHDTDMDALDTFLSANNIYIWLRIHPKFEQMLDEKVLTGSNIRLFRASDYTDINDYLDYFDALITDYSSIYFDFLKLRRPVLFFDYDHQIYDENVGLFDDYEDIKCTPSTTSMAGFFTQLRQIRDGEFDTTNVAKIEKLINYPASLSEIDDIIVTKLLGGEDKHAADLRML